MFVSNITKIATLPFVVFNPFYQNQNMMLYLNIFIVHILCLWLPDKLKYSLQHCMLTPTKTNFLSKCRIKSSSELPTRLFSFRNKRLYHASLVLYNFLFFQSCNVCWSEPKVSILLLCLLYLKAILDNLNTLAPHLL